MGREVSGYEHFVPPAKPRPEYPRINNHVLIKSLEHLREALSCDKHFIAWDTETTGLDPTQCYLVGFSFSFDGKTGYYCPVKHLSGGFGKEALDIFYERLCKAKQTFLFNMRFDYRFMEYAGYDMSKVPYYDVQVACWLSDTNNKACSLKWAERHFLGWDPETFEQTLGDNYNFAYLSPEEAYQYACVDAEGTFAVAQATIQYYKEAKLSARLDNEFLYPLMKFEDNPLPIDTKYLDDYLQKETERLKKLEVEIYEMVGYPFKLNSNKQLGDALQQLGINTGFYTATGQMKVDIKTLEYYNTDNPHPIIEKLIDYSKTFKMINSYLSSLSEQAKAHNNRLRFGYFSSRVPTGRLASGGDRKNPYTAYINIQSSPKPHPMNWYVHDYHDGDEVPEGDVVVFDWRFSTIDKSNKIVEGFNPEGNFRRALPAEQGCYWVSCDFSAQELRCIANYSQAHVWVDTFLHGGDLHKNMAIAMWGAEHYDKEKRKKAKVLNFGMSYGMTGKSLALKFHTTEEEGNEIVNKFWNAVPEVKAFQNACVRKARKTGTAYNYFGRPRRVKFYLNHPEGRMRAFGVRTVNNTVIQSVGAELLKISIIKLWKHLYNNPEYKDHCRFMNTIHDEINSSVDKDYAKEIIPIIMSCMEAKFNGWPVPFVVGLEIGDSFGRTFPFLYDKETKTYQPDWEIIEEN